jgi:hypothetical protein
MIHVGRENQRAQPWIRLELNQEVAMAVAPALQTLLDADALNLSLNGIFKKGGGGLRHQAAGDIHKTQVLLGMTHRSPSLDHHLRSATK